MSRLSPWASTIGVPPCADQPAALPETACGGAALSATADCGGGRGCALTTGEDATGCSGALADRPIEPVVAGSRAGAGACAALNGLSKGVSVKRIVSEEQALTPTASKQTVDRRRNAR